MNYKLPDFLIVGAAKSGTSSLANYLNSHPQIFIPEEKELHFFLFANDPPIYLKNHILGPVLIWKFEDYIKFFQSAKEEVLGEASVTYLYSRAYNTVIKNIKKYHPNWQNLKIIIILRNPIDRAFSQYTTRLLNSESEPFSKAVQLWEERRKRNWSIAYDYLGFSYYFEPVKAYLDNFENTNVYLFEDLKERPLWLIKDLFEFLGVDSSFVPPNLGKKYNVSGVPKSKFHEFFYNAAIKYNPFKPIVKPLLTEHTKERITNKVKKYVLTKPQIDMETREYLKNIFRDDILKLQALIKRDLSHWLK